MKKLLVFIFLTSQIWAQTEPINFLDTELENYKQLLKAQELKTQTQKKNLENLRQKIQEYPVGSSGRKFLEETLVTAESNLAFSIKGEEDFKVLMRMNQEKRSLPLHSRFTNCNQSTPELNLEKETPYSGATFKGPFYNVPRDNQDGLGTCFANTAKNFIVGLSGGKDIPSFIDMAIQYQTQQKLIIDGLDGGNSCETLSRVEEVGYCPQKFSPMETGERNYFTESLFHHEPLVDLSENIDALKGFLLGVEKFKAVTSADRTKALSEAKGMIEKIKANPSVTIPLPVVRVEIPTDSHLYRVHTKKNLSIPFEDFLAEYRESYKKFYPVMIKEILQGKNPKKLFDAYKVSMKSFIDKYQLKKELNDFRDVFLYLAEKDFQEPQFLPNFKKSLQLMKELSGRQNDSDEAFADYCGESGAGMIGFLNTLSPIIDKLKNSELNADVLFDKNGQLKNPRELMQLTVAPKCLASQNRKPVGKTYCQDGVYMIKALKQSAKSQTEKIQEVRNKVVMSLVQGIPLGNSFPVTQNIRHINTIVGLRFNSEKHQCEYLIRESQTGTSSWLPEQQIFEKMEGLTEVRPR